ncbi:glycosyltransferase [Demequina sp. SYSU T00068]|uniref:glycosyltransferase n=1 Tax=Demequina lignilytica TaxID=3051663 RepID=UPI002634C01C|nr:glycosyltransferase [Demequina sp. SYSU T00068]MDN4490825.1 glycosyltransferase [Demequina sp. SYSU T00068]
MTATATTAGSTAHAAADRRIVHRVVLPTDSDPDTLPLYVDFTQARAQVLTEQAQRKREAAGVFDDPVLAISPHDAGATLVSRRALALEDGSHVSFATYFNAFPASYWRRWTDVDTVRLVVELSGPATLVVYKSNARGHAQRVEMVASDGGASEFDLPLAPFGDGGWYWFDLLASDGPVRLVRAEWTVSAAHERVTGTASVGITTFNRPDYCVDQLLTMGADRSLDGVIDRIYVVDQGNQRVKDEPRFAQAAEALGDRLAYLRQGNLGGSGGFSRAMAETLAASESDYVLLLDDDVVSEPEGILRAVAFANFCRIPTIVGGHMFSMHEKSVLHAYAERVNRYSFWWGPAAGTKEGHDFGSYPLRATTWLHRRHDGDYNGWWMCLIPTHALREVGLSLPVFIKWDDSEYALRAGAHGIPTVSLPGAAVWHVPWTDKDDSIDWQAYYHQRNRWLAALLHSPYKRGGVLPRASFTSDVKHLLSLQYSAVELRLKALEELLEGPDHLHRTIGTTLGEVRSMRVKHTDAVVTKDPAAYPITRRHRPPSKGRDPERPTNPVSFVIGAAVGALRQLRPVRDEALAIPEERVASMAAKWWRLSQIDSAVVTSADGTGVSLYVRDRELFSAYLRRSLNLHRKAIARWDDLQAEYRGALDSFTSPDQWKATFAANGVDEDD